MGFYVDSVLPHVINVVMNTEQTREIRRRVCAGLAGEIVEIGFGTGHNLPFLPTAVTVVKAVEPSATGVKLARERINNSVARVDVVGLDGQHLPLPDTSVDAALCTWSLCTIPDPVGAIREIRRVLRPGGALHFAEHGLAPDARVRIWQNRINGIQRMIGGGCHLNRDITAIIESGGLTTHKLDRYYSKDEPKTYGATYEGIAIAA